MKPYLAVLSARFRMLLQYRAAAFAGFCTQLFWGLIRLMIFRAFYVNARHLSLPMSYRDTVTYIWLGQALFALVPFNPVDADVRQMIKSGTVAYELVRPLDIHTLWFFRAIAARLAPTVLRALPIFVVSGLWLGLAAPPTVPCATGWVLATTGAVILAAAFSTLVTISLLWTVSGEGIARLAPTLMYVFSGMIIPLPFYPDWAQTALNVLPFRGMVDAPFRLYMGHIASSQAWLVVAHQMAWTLIFVLAGRWMLARGTKRLVVQGG